MELTDNVSNSVNRYFSYLSHSGYKSYNEVYKLIAYCFIEELLTGELSQFITDEDYRIISRSLECLYGTCMIPYPEYQRCIDEEYKAIPPKLRGSETLEVRITEDGILRTEF